MAIFDITINGKPYCEGDEITTVTVVAEELRRGDERISIHAGAAGEERLQWLAAHLGVGDEIVIRIVDAADAADEAGTAAEDCNFCGRTIDDFQQLVRGREVGICDGCVTAFSEVVVNGAALPLGASIRDETQWTCGFCDKHPGELPGVLVRSSAAICAECLRACADVMAGRHDE